MPHLTFISIVNFVFDNSIFCGQEQHQMVLEAEGPLSWSNTHTEQLKYLVANASSIYLFFNKNAQIHMQIPEIFDFLDIIMNHVANFFISFSFEGQREGGVGEEKD